MFDTATRELIESVPVLEGIAPSELPKMLTKVYANLVTLRTEVTAATVDQLTEDDLQQISVLPRIAHAYGAMALYLDDSEKAASAAAYVAGAAHSLLALAVAKGLLHELSISEPSRDTIPAWMAAALLFTIGGFAADAVEACTKYSQANVTSTDPAVRLSDVISLLLTGKLLDVVGASDLAPEQLSGDDDWFEAEKCAVSNLWIRLHNSVRLLAVRLLGLPESHDKQWDRDVEYVIDVTSQDSDFSRYGFSPKATIVYSGPHHLARLLRKAGDALSSMSVVQVPTPPGTPARAWKSYLRQLASRRPYLWPNHKKALDAGFLDVATSSVITFPTGAGKSILLEMKIVASLVRKRPVVYLVPTRALMDQVRRDLANAIQDVVPERSVVASLIDDGYYSEVEGLDFSVLVMTPERCLTLLAVSSDVFTDVGLVVFDECHLLHNASTRVERRALDAMVCLTRLLGEADASLELVLSSAMVKNARDLADWLGEAFSLKCLVLDDSWKPTRQARGCVVYGASEIQDLGSQILEARRSAVTSSPPASLKRSMKAKPQAIFSLRQTWATTNTEDYAVVTLRDQTVPLSISAGGAWRLAPNRNHVAAHVAKWLVDEGIRTIVFADQPRASYSILRDINQLCRSDPEVVLETEERELYDLAVRELGSEETVYGPVRGIAVCHHGQMLTVERRLSETMFASGRARVIVATPTLAQGMNLPAEAVILAGDDRYEEIQGSRELLKAHEMLNAIGRAGRAGHVSSGFVLLIPGEIITYQVTSAGAELSKRWFTLKDEILGQEDSCIDIVDPIGKCLDLMQSSTPSDDQIVDYFLRRLPDEAAVDDYLGRSLSAYYARLGQTEQHFLDSIAETKKRIADLQSDRDDPVCKALSFETGTSYDFVASLAHDLPEDPPDFTIEEWMTWLSTWISGSPGRLLETVPFAAIARVLPIGGNANVERVVSEAVVNRLFTMLHLWMRGQPLKAIEEASMHQGPARNYTHARLFVINIVPAVSFGAGIISLYYRQVSEAQGNEQTLPLALMTLAACVREGFDSPEKLATYHAIRRHDFTSRVGTHQKFDEKGLLEAIQFSSASSFDEMMQTVEAYLYG